MKKIISFLRLRPFLEMFLLIIVFFPAILLPLLIFPERIAGDNGNGGWLKVDISDEAVWVDTSHWETEKVYISDGYYRDVVKKRWIDTSYRVEQGYWATGQYRVWVEEKQTVPYTAYRYVDTSHWETRYKYVEVIKPVNFTVIQGTDSYGWSVYSFAAKAHGMVQVYYYGTRYLAQKWVIDYNPYRGGRIYAVKYVFMYKYVTEKRPYSVWVSSGYWQPYTAYRTVDTSHWETRTGRYWVDTSYTVESGYWEEYTDKEWVETGHYEYRNVWVEDGYYTEPLHGKIRVEKNPGYVFTRWHRDPDGEECGMDLKVSWEIYEPGEAEGQEPPVGQEPPGIQDRPEIIEATIYAEVKRYNEKGIDRVILYDDGVEPGYEGCLETSAKFDHAGDEESILHIYLYGDGGQVVHAYFSNPINGFRSINLDIDGTRSDAQDWLGGNISGEVEF